MAETPEEIRTDLARRRSLDASERTLLSWIKTGLTMIGFGFATSQVIEALARGRPRLLMDVQIFGISFVALGVLSVIVALIQNRLEVKGINRKEYHYKAPFPLAFTVAGMIIVIGVFTFFAIMMRFRF